MTKEQQERAIILLKATSEILKKVDESPIILSALEQTAVWDDVECDGFCLMEEIDDLIDSL